MNCCFTKIVVWVLFFTHILLVPFILNWNTILLYGDMDPKTKTVILVIHMMRVLVPALFTLLWIYTKLAFLIFCPFALVYFFGSLLTSIVLQCIAHNALSSIFLNLFIGGWVSFSVYGIKQFMKFGQSSNRPSRITPNTPFYFILRHFKSNRPVVCEPRWDPAQSIDAAVISDIKTEMIESGEIDACSICLEGMRTKLMSTACGHVFHTECLLKWAARKTVCPLCNNDLTSGKFYAV